MKIGIIGAGQIGGTLARRLTALGHEVFVANSRGPETLSDLAAETGATAVSVPEAVRGVDLVVVTIPEKNIPSLPAGLFADTPDHVVVVDTGNYYPRQRDGRIEAIETGLPESQWVPLRTSCRALIPVMLWAHWHSMLVVQHWPATASLLCRLAVVTWLAEPLPIMAVPEEPEISTVWFDVIDMLGETGTFTSLPNCAHIGWRLRKRRAAFSHLTV